jgi:hypothetical protein
MTSGRSQLGVSCREDQGVDPVVQLRLREMLEFVERISRCYDQMIALPRSTV